MYRTEAGRGEGKIDCPVLHKNVLILITILKYFDHKIVETIPTQDVVKLRT